VTDQNSSGPATSVLVGQDPAHKRLCVAGWSGLRSPCSAVTGLRRRAWFLSARLEGGRPGLRRRLVVRLGPGRTEGAWIRAPAMVDASASDHRGAQACGRWLSPA